MPCTLILISRSYSGVCYMYGSLGQAYSNQYTIKYVRVTAGSDAMHEHPQFA